ncbi:arginine kinase [Drosophila elegans]|uniref:arginine kinase n=1 Tax=Drosophila elegans TaxID=30023 RepID=UPI0007E79F21|nr:arginine kinase [Drosophila elegans]
MVLQTQPRLKLGILNRWTHLAINRYASKSGAKIDKDLLKDMEESYKKLVDSKSKSLLKKHLTKQIFDKLKTQTTPTFNSTLMHCISSGLCNHDSGVGLYAPDAEAYKVFADLFDPVIEEYHKGFKKTDKQPKPCFGQGKDFENLDPAGNFIVSTRVRCGRAVKGYPFNPCLRERDYLELESKLCKALMTLTCEHRGTYMPLTGMDEAVQKQLIDDHFLFKQGDRFLAAAGASRFWPTGRGIFLNEPKDFMVWCNEEDHIRVIAMEKGGDLGRVYNRMVAGVDALGKEIEFTRDDRLGYLTFCPTNLGTSIRASVHIKLPNLMDQPDELQKLAKEYHLQIRGTSGEHSEAKDGVHDISNQRRIGLTEYEIIKEMHDGIKGLIEAECKAKKA